MPVNKYCSRRLTAVKKTKKILLTLLQESQSNALLSPQRTGWNLGPPALVVPGKARAISKFQNFKFWSQDAKTRGSWKQKILYSSALKQLMISSIFNRYGWQSVNHFESLDNYLEINRFILDVWHSCLWILLKVKRLVDISVDELQISKHQNT